MGLHDGMDSTVVEAHSRSFEGDLFCSVPPMGAARLRDACGQRENQIERISSMIAQHDREYKTFAQGVVVGRLLPQDFYPGIHYYAMERHKKRVWRGSTHNMELHR